MFEEKSELLSVSDALRRLLDRFSPVGTDILPVTNALGRILSRNIVSNSDLPRFTNSSMDGYAVRAADTTGASLTEPIVLKVIGDIPAGTLPIMSINDNEAARIMTGAYIPEGANAVVPVEYTDSSMGRNVGISLELTDILIYKPVNAGDFLRRIGEDVQAGKEVLERGIRIRPQEIGLLAMLGVSQVVVYKRPRVAMLSTGDELVPVSEPLTTGKIHDSNSYALSALLTRDGGDATYLGIIPDREDAVKESLDKAVEAKVDLILSSAGVSVGAFDFVRQVVEKNGRLDFWRVNMRPGKPLAFGEYRGIPIIGLPGNPVSAFVGYEVFVQPTMMKLSGLENNHRIRMKVRLKDDLESDGRESYLRATVKEVDGEWIATLTGHQGSGNLLSLVQANALLIIPSGVKSLPSRTKVEAWMI